MDSEKREIYDKLGPEAAASKHPFNENTMLIEVSTCTHADTRQPTQECCQYIRVSTSAARTVVAL